MVFEAVLAKVRVVAVRAEPREVREEGEEAPMVEDVAADVELTRADMAAEMVDLAVQAVARVVEEKEEARAHLQRQGRQSRSFVRHSY